jgi:hypothetical protein
MGWPLGLGSVAGFRVQVHRRQRRRLSLGGVGKEGSPWHTRTQRGPARKGALGDLETTPHAPRPTISLLSPKSPSSRS